MITLVVLALVAFLLLVVVPLAVLRHMIRRHGLLVLVWRFVSGDHYHGKPLTDAGWFIPGTRVFHPTGRASRWAHRPRAHRAGIRLGAVVFAFLAALGLVAARTVTLVSLAVVLVLGVSVGTYAAVRKVRAWNHARVYVRPLHNALAPLVGVPVATRPGSWLQVPRTFAGGAESEIRIDLPEGFLTTAEARSMITLAVRDKLALEDAALTFRTVGKRPAAIITTSVPPPAMVSFAQVRAAIESASASAPVIGLGRKNVTVSADFDADSPHVLISAGSGGGKSTIVRALVAQGLHNGAVAVVCDIKRISHAWTRGMPNVHYARDIAEIHDTLIAVKAELDRRNGLVDELADENGNLSPEVASELGPRILLVMEEMNATARRLADHWRKVKAKDDPAVSPAVEALGDILFMGRAVLVNVIAVAQMMTARTLGGPEARENFATRIMARYTVNAWRMLAPEVWPMPRSSRHAGRLQVVIGGAARETQGIYMTPAEARTWSLSGTVSAFTLPEPGAALTGSQSHAEQGNEPVSLTGPALRLVGSPDHVGLRQAIESGALTCSIETARWARANDPDFPPPRGKSGQEFLYLPDDLTRWEANRPRAVRAAGE